MKKKPEDDPAHVEAGRRMEALATRYACQPFGKPPPLWALALAERALAGGARHEGETFFCGSSIRDRRSPLAHPGQDGDQV
jgi:hypothetical protein